MKVAALSISGLLFVAPAEPRVEAPPPEYRSTAPVHVVLSLGDIEWVNRECAIRLNRLPDPGMVFEACASQSGWMVMRHGAFYPGGQGDVLDHETGHLRGWRH